MSARDSISKLIEFNPYITNTQICQATGLSRQLVSYHARNINLPRKSKNKSCSFCGKRIGTTNKSGLCRLCRPLQYAYEFVCSECREVHVVTGREATNRRTSKKHKKNPNLDFCNLSCSRKFFMRVPN